jgi:putative restriction endonuclease
MERRNWTKEELILAFNLYLKLPFGKMHSRNADVIILAHLINRSPGSVAMRLTNFANIDPYHRSRGVVGLSGGAKQCQPIWDEFVHNRSELLFESERLLAQFEKQTVEGKYSSVLEDISTLQGETKLREVKTRVNQALFRQIVISSYNGKCAVSGLDITDLLVAGHIIPWSQNEKERLNPENGICLSSLYDKAYDKGYIGISTKYEVLLSSQLIINSGKEYYNKFFYSLKGVKIHLPIRFVPRKEFLEYHLDTIFKR